MSSSSPLKKVMVVVVVAITVFSVGLFLAISLGSMSTLSKRVASTMKDGIKDQTRSNAATAASLLAGSLSEDLSNVAQSVSMVISLQAKNFIAEVHRKGPEYEFPFKTQDSFREYRFQGGCQYPDCPADYGDLTHRSRMAGWNGSTDHSSVYLYQKTAGYGVPAGPVRTDSSWDTVLANAYFVQPVIDALAYQDDSFKLLYQHYNTTVLFYLSLQVCWTADCNSGYTAVHRGYPGTQRNTTSYDPPGRSWFRHAPEDAFFVEGPYKETSTGLSVVTLSSRKTLASPGSAYLQLPGNSTVVTGAVMTLDSLADLIRGAAYPNEGFGVLLKFDTQQVLVWHNASTDTYDKVNSRFYTIAELDPAFGTRNLNYTQDFRYTDGKGTDWVVASTPTLYHRDKVSGKTAPALVMLVFSKWSVATASLPTLHANIAHTTAQVSMINGIIAVVMLMLMVVLMFQLVAWLKAPLTQIRAILARIIEISAEEEKHRDYSAIVDVPWFDLHRSDELGGLAAAVWHMLMRLHNTCEARKARPRYPPNPLHLPLEALEHAAEARQGPQEEAKSAGNAEEEQLFTARDFLNAFRALHATAEPVIASAPPAPAPAPAPASVPIAREVGESNAQNLFPTQFARCTYATDFSEVESGPVHQQYTAIAAPPAGNYTPIMPTVAAIYMEDGDESSDAGGRPAPLPRPRKVFTLRVYLWSLFVVLVLGLCAITVVVVVFLRQEANSWTDETDQTMVGAELLNLGTITSAKAAFITSYFKQVTVDTQVLGQAYTTLLNGNWTSGYAPFQADALYLQSYSLDPTNYYHHINIGASYQINYTISGYFDAASTNCVSSSACAAYQFSNLTKLTSMFDLFMTSYHHKQSSLSFIQTGQEDQAYTRIFPYNSKPYGSPTTCYIEDRTLPSCEANFLHSACNRGNDITTYPSYDARCRRWYQQAAQPAISAQEVVLQYPRTDDGTPTLITAVPVRHHGDKAAPLLGVVSLGLNVHELSASVNAFKILKGGYVYLLDAKNVTNVVLHPGLTAACPTLRCCEATFEGTQVTSDLDKVLLPLQRAQPSNQGGGANGKVISYTKNGQEWRLSYQYVTYGTVDYLLVATVSQKDILYRAHHHVRSDVKGSILGIILGASFVLAFCILVIVFLTEVLVGGVAAPLEDLTQLCERITAGDLQRGNIPLQASLDDLVLLQRDFANMLTALRFGSDNLASGDVAMVQQLFTDALSVYTTINYQRGIAACHNHLGALRVSLRRFQEGEQNYLIAIAMATHELTRAAGAFAAPPSLAGASTEGYEMVPLDVGMHVSSARVSPVPGAHAETPQELIRRLTRLRSDRRGNLALLYAEWGHFERCRDLLHECMVADRESGYIHGCVVKQGNLGNLYLKQGEVQSAEREFSSALNLVSGGAAQNGAAWDAEEARIARQITLLNVANLHLHRQHTALAEHHLVLSLTQGPAMDLATTTLALQELRALLLARNDTAALDELADVVAEHLSLPVGRATIAEVLETEVAIRMVIN